MILYIPEKRIQESQVSTTNLTRYTQTSIKSLLQIVTVRLFGKDIQFEDMFAICDDGSLKTWVDENFLNTSQLSGSHSALYGTSLM